MIYDHAPNKNYTCNAKRKAQKKIQVLYYHWGVDAKNLFFWSPLLSEYFWCRLHTLNDSIKDMKHHNYADNSVSFVSRKSRYQLSYWNGLHIDQPSSMRQINCCIHLHWWNACTLQLHQCNPPYASDSLRKQSLDRFMHLESMMIVWGTGQVQVPDN